MNILKIIFIVIVLSTLSCTNGMRKSGAMRGYLSDIKSGDQQWILEYDSIYINSHRNNNKTSWDDRSFLGEYACKLISKNYMIKYMEENGILSKNYNCSIDPNNLSGKILEIEMHNDLRLVKRDHFYITYLDYESKEIIYRRDYSSLVGIKSSEFLEGDIVNRTILATKSKWDRLDKSKEWENIMLSMCKEKSICE